MLHRWLSIVFTFWLCAAQAQPVVTARFDSAVVETGEAFMLHVEITDLESDTLDLSAWMQVLQPDNILARSGWQKNGQGWKNEVQLICFEAGELVFPPLTVVGKEGSQMLSDSLRLTVIATPIPSTDLNDMADIKGIHTEEKNWTDYIWLAWLVGGIAVLFLLFYWLSSRKKKSKINFRSERLSAYQLAIRHLDRLEQQELWQKGEIKAYYSTLSTILRTYIDELYQTKTLKRGAADAIRQVERLNLDHVPLNALIQLLRNADLAKFAKGQPEAGYHPQAMSDARLIIQYCNK